MKRAILFVGVLFFLLMTMPSYAQKTSKEQKENKTEKIVKKKNQEKKKSVENRYKKNKYPSKTPASKVEEKGIGTPEHPHAKVGERGLDVPDFMKNPNSKNGIALNSQKLTFKNVAFQMKSNENGFELYKNGSSNVYAKLVPTQKDGLYRYTSSTINGAAHFNAKGNLILKYLDNDTGEMNEIQFQSN